MQENIIYWNRCAEELYGWAAREVMGHPAREVLVSEDQQERAAEIMSELKAGRSWSGEFVVRRKDGTLFPVMVTDTPVHDEQGNLVGIIGVSTDISEHKQLKLREYEARRQLQATLKVMRESEARFKRLAEVNIIGVIVTDSMNIMEANEAFLRIVGYTHEDLLWADLHCEEITPPEYYPLDELAAEQYKRSEVCAPYKKEFIRKDGSRVPVLVGSLLSGEDRGNPVLFVLDLSERGRDEEALPEAGETEGRPAQPTSARKKSGKTLWRPCKQCMMVRWTRRV